MNESFIDSLNEEILRIQLPLSVIGNIDKQISSNSSAKNNILLINAYERNSKALDNYVNNLYNYYLGLHENLNSLSGLSFIRHRSTIQDISNDLDLALNYVENIKLSIQNSSMDSTKMVLINYDYSLLIHTTKDIHNDLSELNKVIMLDMKFLLNSIFIVLILVLGFLGNGILRFVNHQLPYLFDSLKNIGDNKIIKVESKASIFFREELDIHNQIDSIIDENILIKNIQDLLFSSYIVDDAMKKL